MTSTMTISGGNYKVKQKSKNIILPTGNVILTKNKNNAFFQMQGDANFRKDGIYPKSKFRLVVAKEEHSNFFKTGIPNEETERQLELELGYQSGTLRANNFDFWSTFEIIIQEGSRIFDMNNPMDKLCYYALSEMDNVANGFKETETKNKYQFIMTNDEYESQVDNAKRKTRFDAIAKARQMSLEDMRDYLTYKQVETDSLAPSIIENRVFAEAEKTPLNFLDILKDELYEYKVIIGKLISKGILKRKNNSYFDGSGNLLGNSIDTAAAYLSKPVNQNYLRQLLGELEGYSKKEVIESFPASVSEQLLSNTNLNAVE